MTLSHITPANNHHGKTVTAGEASLIELCPCNSDPCPLYGLAVATVVLGAAKFSLNNCDYKLTARSVRFILQYGKLEKKKEKQGKKIKVLVTEFYPEKCLLKLKQRHTLCLRWCLRIWSKTSVVCTLTWNLKKHRNVQITIFNNSYNKLCIMEIAVMNVVFGSFHFHSPSKFI